jgi:hypothetical protein
MKNENNNKRLYGGRREGSRKTTSLTPNTHPSSISLLYKFQFLKWEHHNDKKKEIYPNQITLRGNL